MDPGTAVHMVADLLWTGLVVCLPILGLTTLVGVLISVLQVVTQVQEMSLTFVPKLATSAVVLVIGGPWMLRTIMQFSMKLWASIPSMI